MIAPLLLALAAVSAQAKLPPAQALPPPASDEAAVLAPVNALLASFSAGDSAAMLRWVYPDGRVTATGVRASSSGLRQESWAQFAQRIKPRAAVAETISDPAVAKTIGRRIRAGSVYVNSGGLDFNSPFGGYKQSGNGREFGKFGLEEFLETKSVIGELPADAPPVEAAG